MTAPTALQLFEDDFTDGVRVGAGAPWRLRPVDTLTGGDGVVRGTPHGLLVVPTGVNATSGEPAFAAPHEPVQHLRWAAFTTHTSPSGRPGFDTVDGQILTVSADVAVRGLGLEPHPYDDIDDPTVDIRLGAAGLISVDLESGVVCDFFLTHHRLYAVYERLALRPDARFAAFTYAVPVADRRPDQSHHLEISFERATGTARWRSDGAEVLSVDRIGTRSLDAAYLKRDNGGAEENVLPRQFSYGLGLFADRMYGQGVELSAGRLRVTTVAAS
ncbi:DUF6081 family protein [Micromonospora chersina]|uniref:DUF6081 family protein n=1 Tax=Micromonospora chersina TaxID=47854 RepID=UPI00371000B0